MWKIQMSARLIIFYILSRYVFNKYAANESLWNLIVPIRDHSQNMWCCFCQFFTPPYPLVTMTASSTPHHKICDSEPTIPALQKTSQNTNLICSNSFKTLSINRHYFNALLNLDLNSFPLTFSLVCCINESAAFYGDVRRSILIENIDLSSKGHIFAYMVLFCYRQGSQG
jgi:hypothetical protein